MDNETIIKQLDHLTILLDNPESNKGKILYSISSIYSSSMAQETMDTLNKSASLVMSPDLLSILKDLFIEEYCALLASKRLLEVGDLKEDLLMGDVVKSSGIPVVVINKLKQRVGIQDSVNTNVKQDKMEDNLPGKDGKMQSTKKQLKEYLQELFEAEPEISPEDALAKVKQRFPNSSELPQDEKIKSSLQKLKSKKDKELKKAEDPNKSKEEKKKSKDEKNKNKK